jgi:choline dehydrogenase
MGPETDPTAVVDDQLRVRGLERLRVIDASIMPTMLSANLNAGTMMIAEKASDMVLGKPALEPIIVPE